jgi:hypothetical protein
MRNAAGVAAMYPLAGRFFLVTVQTARGMT